MDDLDALHRGITTAERLALIADFPIDRIVCAPGHRSLRHPEAVAEIAARIARGEVEDLLRKPILLGIFTRLRSGKVQLRSVECLDGNHRLLGGLLSGVWQRVGDIPIQGLDARVNGRLEEATQDKDPEDRWVPLEIGLALKKVGVSCSEVPEDHGAKGPTARIPGDIAGIDPVVPECHRSVPLAELLAQWRRA